MNLFCYCVSCLSAMLSCLFLKALWSPVGKGLTSWSHVCDVFSCFVTFPCGVLCWMWYLIVSIPDLCLLPYFKYMYILQVKS